MLVLVVATCSEHCPLPGADPRVVAGPVLLKEECPKPWQELDVHAAGLEGGGELHGEEARSPGAEEEPVSG